MLVIVFQNRKKRRSMRDHGQEKDPRQQMIGRFFKWVSFSTLTRLSHKLCSEQPSKISRLARKSCENFGLTRTSHKFEKRCEARQNEIRDGSVLGHVTKRIAVITPPRALVVLRFLLNNPQNTLCIRPKLTTPCYLINYIRSAETGENFGLMQSSRPSIASRTCETSGQLDNGHVSDLLIAR